LKLEKLSLQNQARDLQKDKEHLCKLKIEEETKQQKLRSPSELAEDKNFQLKFNLPPNEYAITYYTCSDLNFIAGILHITPNYLCFEPIGGLRLFVTESNAVIKLTEIVSINKIKSSSLPGSGTSLEFNLLNNKSILFRGFKNRDELCEHILQLCSSQCKITIYKNGVIQK